MVQAKTEGVTFNPDGTIDLTVDGTVRHLRRLKLREFRHWAEQLRELAKNTNEDATRFAAMLGSITDDTTDEEAEKLRAEVEEANQRRREYTADWIAGVVDQFTDAKPLPEDRDDWPAWLVMDVSVPAQMLAHWRTAPLAPGAKGTN